jgi:hypothetical protein
MEYGLNAKEWMQKCVFLLPEIEKRRIWEKKGFSSIFEYAAKLAGMSHEKVVDALRILRKIKDKPNLFEITEKKGINSIKPIITIVTKENEKYWAEKAKVMSRNTLSAFVKGLRDAKKLEDPHQQAIFDENRRTGPSKTSQPILEHLSSGKTIILMDLNPEIASKLEKLKGHGSWEDLMNEFIEMREKKLDEEKIKAVEQAVKDQKAKSQKDTKQPVSRHIPNAIKKHVLNKTNDSCAFPGCTKPMEILHHTKRFALQKSRGDQHIHEPDSIVPLCKAHERLAHLGLIQNEDGPPEKWKIRKKPDMNYFKSGKFTVDKIVNGFRTV